MPAEKDDVIGFSLHFLHYSYAIIMWEVLSRQIPYEGNRFFYFYYVALQLFKMNLYPRLICHSLILFTCYLREFSSVCVFVCVRGDQPHADYVQCAARDAS